LPAVCGAVGYAATGGVPPPVGFVGPVGYAFYNLLYSSIIVLY